LFVWMVWGEAVVVVTKICDVSNSFANYYYYYWYCTPCFQVAYHFAHGAGPESSYESSTIIPSPRVTLKGMMEG